MEKSQEKSFGFLVGGAFAALAVLQLWRGHKTFAVCFAALSACLLAAALVQPAWLRVPNKLWWRLANALGWVNSRLILSVFFIVILTPVAVLLRLFGKDLLRLRQWKKAKTGWTNANSRHQAATHYEAMY